MQIYYENLYHLIIMNPQILINYYLFKIFTKYINLKYIIWN